MITTFSTSPKPLPLAYEQSRVERIPGVFHEGKSLIVVRGGDISRFCLCCGRPRSGNAIRVHLWEYSGLYSSQGGGDSGIFAIIELIFLLIGLIALIGEFFESRKHFVLYGLCEAHRQERNRLIRTSLLSALAAIGIFAGGMTYLCTRSGQASGPEFWVPLVLGAVGSLGLLILSIVMGARVPGVKLEKEKGHQLWITGAGDAVLLAQPALPIG